MIPNYSSVTVLEDGTASGILKPGLPQRYYQLGEEGGETPIPLNKDELDELIAALEVANNYVGMFSE